MGELTGAEFDAATQMTWTQEDWRAGMGGIIHRLDPAQLASAVKIDATIDEGLMLARDVIASTVDVNPSVFVPGGFGASGTLAMAFLSNRFYTWDYTNKNWDTVSFPAGDPSAGKPLFRNVVPFSGQDYVPGWVDALIADDSPFRYLYKAIGSGTTWSIIFGTVAQPAGCKYMAVANNKLWGGNWADFVDSTVDIVLDGWNTGGTTVSTTSNTGLLAVGDIIALDDLANPEVCRITAINSSTSINVIRGYWGSPAPNHGGTANIFKLRKNTVHHVRSATDATAIANWSSATAIGDSSSEITGLVGVDTDLIVAKTDGLYRVKSDGTVVELRPELRSMTHSHNGRGMFVWQQKVFYPLGVGGMLELDTSTFTIRDISFSKVMSAQTQFNGRVVAGAAEPNRVWVLVLETANTRYHLLMGENLNINGATDYRWHHMGIITYTTGTDAAHATLLTEAIPSGTIVHRRVLIGIESTGSNLLPSYQPQSGDVEDAYTDDTDPEAVTTVWDKNLPRLNMHLSSVTFMTKNLGAGAGDNYIEEQYRIDGGAWTYITGAQATSKLTTSPQTLTFAAEVTGKLLELKHLPRRGTTATSTPQLVNFTVKAQLRPGPLKMIPLELYMADNMMLLNGARGGSPKSDLAQLRTWNANAAEVKLRVRDGTTGDTVYNAVFLPGVMREEVIAQEKGRRLERIVRVALAEV